MNHSEYDKRVEQLIEKVVGLCRLYGAREVLLFGSRAKDTARERSEDQCRNALLKEDIELYGRKIYKTV